MNYKCLIFFQYRAASHLFLKLLLGRPGAELSDRSSVYQDGISPWSQQTVCAFHGNSNNAKTLSNTSVLYTYLGDWWGQVYRPEDVPLMSEAPAPTRWGSSELCVFDDEWLFFSLVRHPRGILASTIARTCELNRSKKFDSYSDYFHVQCLSLRNRLQVILDCALNFPQYYVLSADLLVQSPEVVMTEFARLSYASCNQVVLSNIIDQEQVSQAHKAHSSFGNAINFSHRADDWLSWQNNIFDDIVLPVWNKLDLILST